MCVVNDIVLKNSICEAISDGLFANETDLISALRTILETKGLKTKGDYTISDDNGGPNGGDRNLNLVVWDATDEEIRLASGIEIIYNTNAGVDRDGHGINRDQYTIQDITDAYEEVKDLLLDGNHFEFLDGFVIYIDNDLDHFLENVSSLTFSDGVVYRKEALRNNFALEQTGDPIDTTYIYGLIVGLFSNYDEENYIKNSHLVFTTPYKNS